MIASIIVWGLIAYKIASTINPVGPEIQGENSLVDFKPKATIKVDTFSIEKVERDPFLGTVQLKKKKSSSTNQIVIVKDTLWPTIIFKGMIKKQNSTDQIFVLNINNTQHLLKKGQSFDDITLINGTSKDIVLGYKNKKKSFVLQQ